MSQAEQEHEFAGTSDGVTPDAASAPFVGRWNRLVSTTNWEKGRIIFQWREALIAAGEETSAFSDETWSRLVGAVTPQHVGRLRRVYQRFHTVYEQYQGLFWSHFQAAVDWGDAELWLEGAVQNDWSVNQMREKRWEAMGAPAELKPRESDVFVAEIDEDAARGDERGEEAVRAEQGRPGIEFDSSAETADDSASVKHDDEADDAEGNLSAGSAGGVAVAPFANLPELPDDFADALDHFKLAILRYKADGWKGLSSSAVVACLDALKELTLAPSEE